MTQDGGKRAPRSSYDPKQATEAAAATSDQAIRQAFIAATLHKEQPSARQAQKQPRHRSEARSK